MIDIFFDLFSPEGPTVNPQYQAPQRPWVGLTDEEIKILWVQYRAALPRYLCFAKAIEAKLKEKNNG
jgi:hypothetical protein